MIEKIGKIYALEISDDEKTKIVKGSYLGKKYFNIDSEGKLVDFETAKEEELNDKKLFYLFTYRERGEIKISATTSKPEQKNKSSIKTTHLNLDFFLSNLEIEFLNKRIKNWSKNKNAA